MKKLMSFLLPFKLMAASIFAGLMVLYLVAGYVVAAITGDFYYGIPFIFVIEGIVLSLVIAALWGAIFGEQSGLNWRYFHRLIVFCLSMAVLLTLSVLVFFGWHTDWAKLWWIVIACIMAGIVAVSVLGEVHFRRTGRRYTELLQTYQATHTP